MIRLLFLLPLLAQAMFLGRLHQGRPNLHRLYGTNSAPLSLVKRLVRYPLSTALTATGFPSDLFIDGMPAWLVIYGRHHDYITSELHKQLAVISQNAADGVVTTSLEYSEDLSDANTIISQAMKPVLKILPDLSLSELQDLAEDIKSIPSNLMEQDLYSNFMTATSLYDIEVDLLDLAFLSRLLAAHDAYLKFVLQYKTRMSEADCDLCIEALHEARQAGLPRWHEIAQKSDTIPIDAAFQLIMKYEYAFIPVLESMERPDLTKE